MIIPSQNQAIIIALLSAFMWGTWPASIKFIKTYPINAYFLLIFIFSFILVWFLGIIIYGNTLILKIIEVSEFKIAVIFFCGMIFVGCMELNMHVMAILGLALSQPLQQVIGLIIGNIIAVLVGGIPENFSIYRIVICSFFLTGSIFFIFECNKSKIQVINHEDNQNVNFKKAIILSIIAAILGTSYTFSISYGLKSITRTNGLEVVPFMCVFVSGAFLCSILVNGKILNKRKQLHYLITKDKRIYFLSIWCATLHYGGNILHCFSTSILSSTISSPLGLTSGLWTQMWGIISGEFKEAPKKAYIFLGASVICYILGEVILVI